MPATTGPTRGPQGLRVTGLGNTYILLSFLILMGASGDLFLSRGMKEIGGLESWTPAALLDFLRKVFLHPVVWLGLGALIGYALCYSVLLSGVDFSYVLPASALTYVLVPVVAFAWLGERPSLCRWGGIVCIFAGVVLVGTTAHTTKRPLSRGCGAD